ncbi:hypothetical protein VM98_34425 [Streptomyces rubellomurinus subsp. indigoferus]|nr:hypothetical protein VM98_34425 [Streptomyces rubellomurinus subsp. indigoferus]
MSDSTDLMGASPDAEASDAAAAPAAPARPHRPAAAALHALLLAALPQLAADLAITGPGRMRQS